MAGAQMASAFDPSIGRHVPTADEHLDFKRFDEGRHANDAHVKRVGNRERHAQGDTR